MASPLTFAIHGAQRFDGALGTFLPDLGAAAARLPRGEPGIRLRNAGWLRPLCSPDGPIGQIAGSVLGEHSRAVRAILFDKATEANWSLGWHQDRTICVRRRVDIAGFARWTIKGGMQHVEPPFDLLSRMVTLRAHIDDVPITNAPLLIAPGSHRLGRLAESEIDRVVDRCGVEPCLAEAGDVWLYSTPILHASHAASKPGRRRVLQIDFAAEALPGGLEWLGT